MLLHEVGYDYRDLPQIHLSEQRRALEGKFALMELERDREMARMGQDPQEQKRRRESNQRALERFKENR